MTMSISNWSLAHISKVCNNVQYGAPYNSAAIVLVFKAGAFRYQWVITYSPIVDH